jgi:hypothetical protein
MDEFEIFTTVKIPFSFGNALFSCENAPNASINGAIKDEFGTNAYQNGLNAYVNVPNLYAKSTKSRGNGAFPYMTGPNRVVNRPFTYAFASFTSIDGLFSIIKIVAKLSIDGGKQRFEAKIPVTVPLAWRLKSLRNLRHNIG